MLLGPGLIAHDEPDMEPLTDFATIFIGMGSVHGQCRQDL